MGVAFVAGIIRLYWKFPAESIHKNRQTNRPGSSQIDKCIHCGTGGPARIKDIIDQNNDFVIDIEANFRGSDLRLCGTLRRI